MRKIFDSLHLCVGVRLEVHVGSRSWAPTFVSLEMTLTELLRVCPLPSVTECRAVRPIELPVLLDRTSVVTVRAGLPGTTVEELAVHFAGVRGELESGEFVCGEFEPLSLACLPFDTMLLLELLREILSKCEIPCFQDICLALGSFCFECFFFSFFCKNYSVYIEDQC